MNEKTVLLLAILALTGFVFYDGPGSETAPATCQESRVAQDTLEGGWEGSLGSPPNTVSFSICFSEESGTFSIVEEGVREVPLHRLEADGGEVVAWLTPQRSFRGIVDGDSLRGHLVFQDRDGHREALVLFRVGTPAWEELQVEMAQLQAERISAPAPGLEEASRGIARDRVDPVALERLVDAARESRTSALVVLQGGDLVGGWYDPDGARRIEAMSVTKSILGLAVGRLLELEKLESIDVPVHSFYPEWEEGRRSRITIRHILTHTSGLATPMPATPIYQSTDFVRYALDSEMESEPGTEFVYNNSATNLLAGIIGLAAGERADRFIREELFEPLGITDFTWSLDPAGNPHGMAGLQIHAEDLARLGQLVLEDGVWNGERLLPEGWIARSLSPAPEPAEGAGFLWWLIHDEGDVVGARADGYLGQYLVIDPDSELVGVRMVEDFEGYTRTRDGFPEFQEKLRGLRP